MGKIYEKYIVTFQKFLYETVEGEYNYIVGKVGGGTERVTKHGKRWRRSGLDPNAEPVTVGPYFALCKKEAIAKAWEEYPEYKSYLATAKNYRDILRERKKQSNESK